MSYKPSKTSAGSSGGGGGGSGKNKTSDAEITAEQKKLVDSMDFQIEQISNKIKSLNSQRDLFETKGQIQGVIDALKKELALRQQQTAKYEEYAKQLKAQILAKQNELKSLRQVQKPTTTL